MTEHAVRRWSPNDAIAAPLDFYTTPVLREWVDYNGHMTEAAYLTVAGWAADALFRYIGDDDEYRAAGNSFYTVETHIHYLREAVEGEVLRATTQLLGVDQKRVHLVTMIVRDHDGAVLSSVEQMLLHVDMNAGRSTAILPDVQAALDAIMSVHASMRVPAQVGTVMALPSR